MSDNNNEFKKKEIKGIFTGPVLPVLLRLSLPILTGMFFQLLYNITDTIWISRIDLNDPSYVGGTGIVFPVIFLAIALSNGILVGISSQVARGIGERNNTIINSTIESGLFIAIILSIIIIVFAYLFDQEILDLLGAQGLYRFHALEYFRYIIPAASIMFIMSVFNGILQGEGLMKYVMISMIIGTVGNIILDPVFIFVLHLGVRGAALATDIAQVFAVLYGVSIFIKGKTLIKATWKKESIHWTTVKNIISIGVPQSLAQILMAISFLIFNRVVVGIDPYAFTAFALCGRFDQAVLMPIFALGAAVVTMVGQNAGRRNFERVQTIWLYSLLSSAGAVLFMASLMFIFAPNIYGFFSSIQEVVNYSVIQTRILEYSFIFAAIGIISRSFFQATGFPLPALIITLMRLIIIAVPAVLIYVYIFHLKMYGVWFGLLTGNSLSAFISYFWTLRTLKRLKNGSLKIKHS